MTTTIKTQLDAIVGKTFNYLGKNVTIDSYKEVGAANVVVFMPNPRNFLISEIPDFLFDLAEPLEKDLTPAQVAVPKTELQVFEPTKENATVKATLLEALEKVKTDPSYIAQAQAVCNVVSQIVNVQKTEIQMLQLVKKGK